MHFGVFLYHMWPEEVFVLELVRSLFLACYELEVSDRHVTPILFLLNGVCFELIRVVFEVRLQLCHFGRSFLLCLLK